MAYPDKRKPFKSLSSLSDNSTHYQKLEIDPKNKSGIDELLENEEGYIVGRIGNELLRYKTDAHLLTIAPTGGGKGTGLIIPNLLDHEGSAVVVDIRGETVATTATARRLLGHRVVVLDPYNITKGKWGEDTYNPFDRLIDNKDSRLFDDQIQRFVSALMFDPSGRMSNEPIWDNATRNLLSGLVYFCLKYWPPFKHNLGQILDVLNYSQEELDNFIIEIASHIKSSSEAKNDRNLKSLYKTLTEAKGKTKITDNAIVQSQTLLSWVGNRSFEDILDDSTFTFESLQKEKMTVYLVVPEEFIDNCAIWVRLMLESAIFSLDDIYQSRGISTSQLPQEDRVLFLLDELPVFGQLDIVSKGMATLRGRGVNLWLFIQNLSQLESTYGKETTRTIIGNAAALQVFSSNELEELEYFSRLIGEDFYDVQSISISDSETQGTSRSIGQSNTISNSQSFSKTSGSSDSYAEATNINWTKTKSKTQGKGKSTNKGFSTNIGYGKTKGTSEGTSQGTNKSEGETTNRNWLGQTTIGTSKGKGKNKGKTQGKNQSTQSNRGFGSNYGYGFNETESHTEGSTEGGGSTSTNTTTTNESETESHQYGTSSTSSINDTTSQSTTRGRSITVKQERMKIETIRSIREKISGRNQLLQIRNHHPFFVPRMSFFVKFIDVDRFMFPDMVCLASIDAFDEIINRTYFESEFPDQISELYRQKKEALYKAINSYEEKKNNTLYEREVRDELLQAEHSFIQDDLTTLYKELKKVETWLDEQRVVFNEVSIAAIGYFSILKNLDSDACAGFDQTITDFLAFFEHQSNLPKQLPNEIFVKYSSLPLAQLIRHGYYYEKPDGKYLIYGDEEWLAKTYLPVVKKLDTILASEVERLTERINKQEEFRFWLREILIGLRHDFGEIIKIAMKKEEKMKNDFFLSRNSN
ncbi:MAG: type IV secretory system conjugative DNA transfer family protein [Bacteroidota bacterium]